jgi:hypothetical protein
VDCGYRRLFEQILAENQARSFIPLEFNSMAACFPTKEALLKRKTSYTGPPPEVEGIDQN